MTAKTILYRHSLALLCAVHRFVFGVPNAHSNSARFDPKVVAYDTTPRPLILANNKEARCYMTATTPWNMPYEANCGSARARVCVCLCGCGKSMLGRADVLRSKALMHKRRRGKGEGHPILLPLWPPRCQDGAPEGPGLHPQVCFVDALPCPRKGSPHTLSNCCCPFWPPCEFPPPLPRRAYPTLEPPSGCYLTMPLTLTGSGAAMARCPTRGRRSG